MRKILLLASLLSLLSARAFTPTLAAAVVTPQIGDTYEITLTKDSKQSGPNGSSGSSHDVDSVVERVVGIQSGGLELEYDLPKIANADERASNWQFPVRILEAPGKSDQLLNSTELEGRVDRWLKEAKLPRTACGHWIFTWNAFRIECDPQSALKAVEAFDLRSADVREGASYRSPAALGSGTLTEKASGPNSKIFAVNLPIDPDAVRRDRAEADVVVGEIMKQPITFAAALQKHANDNISGTVSIEFEIDSAGSLIRRTTVTTQQIKDSGGQSGTNIITETLRRRRVLHND